MNREQLAWAAGIIDGEGYIANHKNTASLKIGIKRTYYVPHIKVAQTAKYGGIPDMIERLINLFENSRLRGPYQRRKQDRDIYEWGIYGFERTQAALCAMWPWLGKQKRRDAVSMMEEFLGNRPPMEWRKGPAKGSRQDWERDYLGRFVAHD